MNTTILALTLTFVCPDPQMINRSSDPWNEQDIETVVLCEKACEVPSHKAMCLKRFIKWGNVQMGMPGIECDCEKVKR